MSAWIVQDGNYPDFAVGDNVEFYQPPGTAITSSDSAVSALALNGSAYGVIAAKVMHSDRMTVLDIGIFVYREHGSSLAAFDDLENIRTELDLGIDP